MAERPLRVLVVEDEKLIRWAVSETLRMGGHDVVEAGDARSAREILYHAPEPVDVVVLDYRLPDSTGFPLIDELHDVSPATGVVMMTAQSDAVFRAAAMKRGARRVLDKPFDLSILDSAVREAADHPGAPARHNRNALSGNSGCDRASTSRRQPPVPSSAGMAS
jgi:DNA-binding NtrC family response regulator